MKKLLLNILIASFLLSSCSLDVEPTDRYSDGIAWSDEKNLDIYVKGFYTALRDKSDLYSTTMSDGLSDIFKYSVNNLNGLTFQNKLLLQDNYITPNNGVLSEWGNYGSIKRQNEFLANMDKNGQGLSADFLKVRSAEVRFLRAYLYFLMARNHGGVILRLHNSGINGGLDAEGDAKKSRATEAETWAFIVQELQAVAADLKGHAWPASDYGRITEGAALALLSRAGLYAKDYELVINAGKRIEELGYVLSEDYKAVFTNKLNKEIILPLLFDAPDYVQMMDRYFQPVGDNPNRGGWGGPTEELVSAYQIKKDGKYVDFDWLNADHKAQPYVNREPRFYASILYNGASWKGRTVETFVGAKDGFVAYDANADIPGNITGYYMRKFLKEDIVDVDLGSDNHGVLFRLGEVYLNMAEAYGQKSDFNSAYAYLNKIRNRAGVDPRPVSATPAILMNLLVKERMLELAFEGFRYWDLRRLKLAESLINGKRATGVRILKNGSDLSYERLPIEGSDRIFQERYYYIPIPQSEIMNNPLATQNIGW